MSNEHDASDVVAVRVDVDGSVTALTDDSYATLRAAVGGLIEACPTAGSCIVWVNEEGKVNGLPRNLFGEALWFLVGDCGCLAAGDWMAGPCVITGPADREGELTPVPAWVLDTAATMTAIATVGRRRFPMDPLEDWLNRRYSNHSASTDRQTGGRLSTERIAELVGFSRQAVRRWRDQGIPLWSADRAAINAGVHPAALWDDFAGVDTPRHVDAVVPS